MCSLIHVADVANQFDVQDIDTPELFHLAEDNRKPCLDCIQRRQKL